MYDSTKPYEKEILNLISQTWETPFVSVQKGIYPIVKKNINLREVNHTDGIGTKGFYHWQKRTFENASLDSLAMNLNDLVLSRAVPYCLQNHIFIPEDNDEAILRIIKSISNECKKREIAMTGGETSIHENMHGMDISMTVSGFVKNNRPNEFYSGDVLIGIPSNGIHSNGFTKIRELFDGEYREDFVRPTSIYFDKINSLEEWFKINGMMHITGGAYTKLRKILGNNDLKLKRDHKLKPQKIFLELYEKGISDEEMYKTFNCGVGFIVSTSKKDAEKVAEELKGEIIGSISKGNGKINIESMFSKREIEV